MFGHSAWALAKGLRPAYLVGAILLWNAGWALGMWLNGGLGQVRNLPATITMTVVCGSFSAAFFGLGWSSRVQAQVLKPGADIQAMTEFAIFAGGILAFLAVAALLSLSFSNRTT